MRAIYTQGRVMKVLTLGLIMLGALLSLRIETVGAQSINRQAKRFVVKRVIKQGAGSLFKGISNGKSKAKTQTEIKKVPEGKSAEEFVQELKADNYVVSVEEDLLMNHQADPSDFGTEDDYYNDQWHYWESGSGIKLEEAWDIFLGSPSTVIAVIDTGILNHSDLSGRVLPGADMISDTSMSNDGDGRDNNASDPGDWVSFGDPCSSSGTRTSSWHGTHVAGTIAANTGNGSGAAGINIRAKILPVRVLGKCGGYSTDIADGIRWAAGGSVSGVTNNPTPAQVINLSLGGPGSCPGFMQDAINFATNQGALVVVAAGNSNTNIDFQQFSPANCRNVITVAASNRSMNRASYSNYGSKIDITAPGGEGSNGVLSLANNGNQSPRSDSFREMSGTSMATPHVVGVASLIMGMKPDLPPLQVKDILLRTVSGSVCSQCGVGFMDAFAALQESQIVSVDNSFRSIDSLGAGSSNPPNEQEVLFAYQDEGGACGSVAFINAKDDDGGNGGGGSQNFFLSLLLGLMMAVWITKQKRLNE